MYICGSFIYGWGWVLYLFLDSSLQSALHLGSPSTYPLLISSLQADFFALGALQLF